MRLTQRGQSSYRKHFTSYSNKPTKLWKRYGAGKKERKKGKKCQTVFSLVVPQGLGAGSQLAREGPG